MNLTNKLSANDLKANKNKIKKIFLYRVCGTGMGACACLLREKGYEVEGGDQNFYPPMSTYLESTGIPLHNLKDFDMNYLKEFDLIVVGNAVPRASEEARLIEEVGVSFSSFPTALGSLVLDDVNVVGLAGTHGKTTTTYLMTQVFEKLGFNPGYFIGGVIEGRNSSSLGDGKYFFIESDEYDSAYFEKISKFRLYSLDHMILTSLEFDHADIFNDIEDIKDEFRSVLKTFSGKIFYDTSYKASRELISEHEDQLTKKSIYTYGDEEVKIKNVSENGTQFSVCFEHKYIEFNTNLVGKHNILNLSSVILFALSEGLGVDNIKKAVSDLSLVRRRQEIRGTYKNAIVIDDFAHHPRAVELTTDGIKSLYPDKLIKVVIEPNSATARSDIFQNEFSNALKIADYVIFAKPSRSSNVKGTKDLDGYKIIQSLKENNVQGKVVEDLLSLRAEIDNIVDDETILLVLSNGTCLGLWQSSFVDELVK